MNLTERISTAKKVGRMISPHTVNSRNDIVFQLWLEGASLHQLFPLKRKLAKSLNLYIPRR